MLCEKGAKCVSVLPDTKQVIPYRYIKLFFFLLPLMGEPCFHVVLNFSLSTRYVGLQYVPYFTPTLWLHTLVMH